MSKSRPVYGPLRIDTAGRRHLLISQGAQALTLCDDFGAGAAGPVEVWTVADAETLDRALKGGAAGAQQRFASAVAMSDALTARLRRETMGLRLYGVGEEAFLWNLFGLASAAGLGRQEVVLSRIGDPARRVRCVHCGTMNEDVRADLVVCSGCGLTLQVRDHFSRRLSAYMGVHADAEAPGELAAPQPLA